MPIINKEARKFVGLTATEFVDSIGTSAVTFTLQDTSISQDTLKIQNLGPNNLIVTVGAQSNVTIQAYKEMIFSESFTAFTLQGAGGNTSFRAVSSYQDFDETDENLFATKKEYKITGNTVVALGDSITAGNVDLINNAFGDTSWFQQLIVRSKGKLQYVYNAGVPGNTTTQMLARIQTDVITKKPKICFILGGTNDLATISSDVTRANIEKMINILLSNKITPVLCTIPPRNDATLQTAVSKVNINVRALAIKYGLHLIDFYSSLVDPSNGYYKNGTTLSTDGIHPTPAGAKIMSNVVEQNFLPILPVFASQLAGNNVSGVNLLTNALFLNDTNADGVPDNWIAYGGIAANVTHSIVSGDTAILGNWVQMQINTSTTRIVEATINTGFSVGDKIAIFGKIQATAEAGSLNYDVKLNFTGASQSIKVLSGWTRDIDGAFYMEITVPTGTTSLVFDLVANSGTGTLKLSQCGIVNLTSLGL